MRFIQSCSDADWTDVLEEHMCMMHSFYLKNTILACLFSLSSISLLAQDAQLDLNDTTHSLERALYLYGLQEYDAALALYDQLIHEADAVKNRQLKGEAFVGRARIYYDLENYKEALRNLLKANKEFIMLGDSLMVSQIACNIGMIYLENDLYENAVSQFETSLQFLSDPNSELYLNINKHYAQSLCQLGKFEQSHNLSESLLIHPLAQDYAVRIELYDDFIGCLKQAENYPKMVFFEKEQINWLRSVKDTTKIIESLLNLTYAFRQLNFPDSALLYLDSALNLLQYFPELKDSRWHAYSNKVEVLLNLEKAKQALLFSEQLIEWTQDHELLNHLDNCYHQRARVLLSLNEYQQALSANKKALQWNIKHPDAKFQAAIWRTESAIRKKIGDFQEALFALDQYLYISDSLKSINDQERKEINDLQYMIEKKQSEINLGLVIEEFENLELQALRMENARNEKARQLLQERNVNQKLQIEAGNLERERLKQQKLLVEEKLKSDQQLHEIQQLESQKKLQELELQNEKETSLRNMKELEITKLRLSKIQSRNIFLVSIAALALLIAFIIFRSLRFARKTNKKLAYKNTLIENEKKKSDRLLLNILPAETAHELKEHGFTKPRSYNETTVLFTDFKGFTKISEGLSPNEIVQVLDYCFQAFDDITKKHGLEKIKTIGDSYMCAGGIPLSNNTHASDAVKAALEMRDFIGRMNDQKKAQGLMVWDIRIGLHTGSLVSGVVGKHKFAYDIWGDTVNTASRMESSGAAGKVNISETTFGLVKNEFECTYRGKVSAKNKGEIDMYFVEQKI